MEVEETGVVARVTGVEARVMVVRVTEVEARAVVVRVTEVKARVVAVRVLAMGVEARVVAVRVLAMGVQARVVKRGENLLESMRKKSLHFRKKKDIICQSILLETRYGVSY